MEKLKLQVFIFSTTYAKGNGKFKHHKTMQSNKIPTKLIEKYKNLCALVISNDHKKCLTI